MRSVRKIYLSSIAVTFFLLIFGTVTYAWIGLSNVNTIENMSLTATTGNQLEISLDGTNYSRTLSSDTLEDLFGRIELADVTTRDLVTFESGGLNESREVIANKSYLTFDLWFRTTERERHIYLVNNKSDVVTYDSPSSGTFVVSRGVNWRAPTTFINGPDMSDIVEEDQEGIYYASDAVRIGVKELNDPENELDERDEEQLETLIFDPSENPDRGYGKAYGAFSYFVAKTGLQSFSLPDQKPETTYRLTEFAPFNPYIPLNDDSLIAELLPSGEEDEEGRPYLKGKVRVSVWVEGWDADAFDAIARDRIKIQLEFKAGYKNGIY
ncbi:MAG: hypothetical protein ACLFTZ_03910 [Acholeplasmataceae bacterium]